MDMKFKEHPQAKLIPQSVWEDYFSPSLHDATQRGGILDEQIISLMKANIKGLDTQVKDIVKLQSTRFKKQVWLAIVLSHPGLNNSELRKLCQIMDLPLQESLELAVVSGQLDFFCSLEKEKIFPNRESSSLDAYIPVAARHGYLHIIKHLLQRKALNERKEVFKANDFKALQMAIAGGHLYIVEYIVPEEIPIGFNIAKALESAVKGGHLHVLKYLVEKLSRAKRDELVIENLKGMLQSAAKIGCLNIIQYLEEKIGGTQAQGLENIYTIIIQNMFKDIVKGGHLNILKHLHLKLPDDVLVAIKQSNYECFRLAAYYGHLDILIFLEQAAPGSLKEIAGQPQGAFSNAFQSAFECAYGAGDLEMLRFLEANVPEDKFREMVVSIIDDVFIDDLHHLEPIAQYLAQKLSSDMLDSLVKQTRDKASMQEVAQGGIFGDVSPSSVQKEDRFVYSI